jgi:ComF family protein
VFSVFPYQGDCRRILRAYKFASQRNLGRFFRDCLVQAAASPFWENRLAPEKPGAPAWVPVPPRPGKIRKTGWDQVEFLAKLLEKDGKEVCRCLERLGSDTQKILGREKRRNNLRGKIRIRNDYAANKKPIPETALVFDDVYTTGSTMDACAEALKMGGTTTVYGICLFYG